MVIQELLAEAAPSGQPRAVSVDGRGIEAAADWSNLKSPEKYVSYARGETFSSPGAHPRINRRL
jgi:hypothetical protein